MGRFRRWLSTHTPAKRLQRTHPSLTADCNDHPWAILAMDPISGLELMIPHVFNGGSLEDTRLQLIDFVWRREVPFASTDETSSGIFDLY